VTVIVCVAATRAAVLKVASPVAPNLPVPKLVVPSQKVTVPVGTPVSGSLALATAVNVTAWPKTDGEAEVLIVVVLARIIQEIGNSRAFWGI
jgi:hypothetical protein